MNTTVHFKRTLPMPLWLQGTVELALVALVSYLTVGLILTAVWYAKGFDTDTLAGALSVAGHIWLLVHGVPLEMNIPAQGAYPAVAGTMSLIPLGLTLIPLALCYRSGRRLARASYEGQFWQPLVGGMVAYSVVSTGISLVSTDDYFSTSPLLAALVPLWVTALGIVAGGYAESRSLAAMIGVDAADWVKKFSQYSRWAGSYVWAMFRASLVGVLAYMAASALLLVVSIFWHWDKVVGLYEVLQAGAVGGFALTFLQCGLLFNLVIYAMAWTSGAGFALGAGTSVNLTATEVGIMPSVPLLGALPHASEPWGYTALALPLLAGAVAGWWFFREGENHFDEWLSLTIRFRWISWTLSTLTLALLTFIPFCVLLVILGWIANGSLGIGRFTEVGPSPLLFGACGGLLLAGGTAIGLGLAHLLVRDTSLELERFASEKPTRSEKKQEKADSQREQLAEEADTKDQVASENTREQGNESGTSEVPLSLVEEPEDQLSLSDTETSARAPWQEETPGEVDTTEQAVEPGSALVLFREQASDDEQDSSASQSHPEETGEADQKTVPVVKRPKSLQRRWKRQLGQDATEEQEKTPGAEADEAKPSEHS